MTAAPTAWRSLELHRVLLREPIPQPVVELVVHLRRVKRQLARVVDPNRVEDVVLRRFLVRLVTLARQEPHAVHVLLLDDLHERRVHTPGDADHVPVSGARVLWVQPLHPETSDLLEVGKVGARKRAKVLRRLLRARVAQHRAHHLAVAEALVHRVRAAVVVAHLAVLSLRRETSRVAHERAHLVVRPAQLRAFRLHELVLAAPAAPVAEVHLGAGRGRGEVAEPRGRSRRKARVDDDALLRRGEGALDG